MSFTGNGEYRGHTGEDDEYEQGLRVGAYVSSRAGYIRGIIMHIVTRGWPDSDSGSFQMYVVRWDEPVGFAGEYFARELTVIG